MSEPLVSKGGSTLSGALFVAGTSVGAGMLALPFATGVAGFWPAMTANLLCWLFMLCTGLLFLEVTLWMPDGSNVMSMTRRFLGLPGKVVGGVGFLYLYYCLLVAYFSGGSPIWSDVLHIPPEWGMVTFVGVFGLFIFLGAYVTDKLNYLLMAGLIISYIMLIGIGSAEVSLDKLTGSQRWGLGFVAAPTIFSAYGYHNIVPSISTYLKRNPHKLRWAIGIGTFIPFVVYALWQWLIIGTVPLDLLEATRASGESIATPLAMVVQNSFVVTLARYFALFAIQTSVLGVGLSMVDFLGDGTGIPRRGLGRLLLTAIVFLPPFIFAYLDPGLFFVALHYAGVFGEATLNGFIPVLMVWVGRYKHKLKSDFRLPGGKVTLVILMVITLAIIGSEVVDIIRRALSWA